MIDLAPNITLLFQCGIFFIALIVLHFFIFKPSLLVIEERKKQSQGSSEVADKLTHETEEMTKLCEKKMEEARALGIRKKIEKMDAGEKFRDSLLKKIRADVDAKLEEVSTKIKNESQKASALLNTSAQNMAQSIAAKILEREI